MVRRKTSLHPPDTELYASENSPTRNNSSESLKGRLSPSNSIEILASLSISVSPQSGRRSGISPPCEASMLAAIATPATTATTAAPTPTIELVAAPTPPAIAPTPPDAIPA